MAGRVPAEVVLVVHFKSGSNRAPDIVAFGHVLRQPFGVVAICHTFGENPQISLSTRDK